MIFKFLWPTSRAGSDSVSFANAFSHSKRPRRAALGRQLAHEDRGDLRALELLDASHVDCGRARRVDLVGDLAHLVDVTLNPSAVGRPSHSRASAWLGPARSAATSLSVPSASFCASATFGSSLARAAANAAASARLTYRGGLR
jgi:hypothetical protein